MLLPVVCYGDPEPKRILILHSFGREFSPYSEMAKAFRAELSTLSDAPIEFRDASLEMARFDGAEIDEPLRNFLKAMYSRESPDLLVPIGAQAAMFCVRHRESLFPETPILTLSVDTTRLPGLIDQPDVTSAGIDLDVDAFIENILQVRPDTKHIFVAMGTAPLEQFWEAAFRREWANFEDRVSLHWLSNQSVAQMKETVRTLPPDSAVLVGIVNLDAAGVPHEEESALIAIRETSNSPIFGMLPTQLGLGIVGGPLGPGPKAARAGAEAAVKIFSGIPAGEIPIVQLPLSDPVYDWRELQRWSIPETRLPAHSSIRFRQPTLWEEHKTLVLSVLGVFAIQSLLIAFILSARRNARESEASLSLAADAAEIGLWRRSANNDKLFVSSQLRRILGLPSASDVDMFLVNKRLHPEDRDRVVESIERAADLGNSFSMQHRIVRPDGEVRWVQSHGRAIPGATRQGYGTHGALIDITDRLETIAREELQRQELAHLSRVSSLGVLSGAIAHELNQPLSIILSNAQAAEYLLESEEPDLEELRAMLADIVKEDSRAGNVIKRLRSLLQRGERVQERIDVNVNIRDVLRIMNGDLIRRGVELHESLETNLPQVLLEGVHLQQVLINIILNACDAMEENKSDSRQLLVESFQNSEEIRIAVHDRGTGLPEDPEELFQPFHSTKPEGLGLGLPICRTLVSAHGGRLWAEPNPEGGAIFIIALPKTTAPS